jgi:CubicO group peptidase (beta-lactamase class C family)
MMERALSLVQESVRAGKIPGAALGWIDPEGGARAAYLGQAQIEPTPLPLLPEMYFDLASLTKVLFTVPEILHLVEEGLADLDEPLGSFLPELGWLSENPLRRVTLRELLTHTAGLPAWAPIYTWGSDPSQLKARLLQEPWNLGAPVYSDLGYIFLGLVLERVRRKPLSAFELPPGLTFHPQPEQSVASEWDPWRGRLLRGEVHDENAAALGGVAGHAGLFGTLEGVLLRAQALLRGELLSPAALEEMRRPHTSERALGWQRKHPGWSGGSLASPSTLGHTGFTGTGVWIDFERGYAWALLTHRVHPSRHRDSEIHNLRRRVGDAIAARWRSLD